MYFKGKRGKELGRGELDRNDCPGHITSCLSGYPCLFPGIENVPVLTDIRVKTPPCVSKIAECLL